MPYEKFNDCIEACESCAMTCNYCAMACLEEDAVNELTNCIRRDMECAAFCRSTAEILSLNSSYSVQLCQLCANICNDCAEECEKHAKMGMEHCRECAAACRLCATACKVKADA